MTPYRALFDGELPGPETDSDVIVLTASALADYRRSRSRNTLLTLARVLVAVETGVLVPKHVATELEMLIRRAVDH